MTIHLDQNRHSNQPIMKQLDQNMAFSSTNHRSRNPTTFIMAICKRPMTGRLLPASKFSRLAKSTYVPDSMLSTDATPVLLKNSGCEKNLQIILWLNYLFFGFLIASNLSSVLKVRIKDLLVISNPIQLGAFALQTPNLITVIEILLFDLFLKKLIQYTK